MDLVNIEPDRLNAIVQTCPTEKRSALAKALRAACRHLQDSGKKYDEAFELACAMAENWWQLGNELRRLKEAGLLRVGQPEKNGEKIHHSFTLAELGVSKKQSSACQRLAEKSKEELLEWLGTLREKQKFPVLHDASKKSRSAATKSMKAPDVINVHPQVRKGDFREVLADVEYCDAILTDPPYGKKYLQLWSDLAQFAAERLTDSGILIAYSGQLFLDEVFARLSEHLTHWWTLAVVHEGSGNLTPLGQPVRKVINKWKPVVVFMKNGATPSVEVFEDIIPGVKPNKDDHNWSQPIAEASWLLEVFTLPGDIVVDPMAGSGTVAYACELTGRGFIGAEIGNGSAQAES